MTPALVCDRSLQYTDASEVDCGTDENYRWDLPDGSGRIYIPDVFFVRSDPASAEEERAAVVLAIELTLPSRPAGSKTILKRPSVSAIPRWVAAANG